MSESLTKLFEYSIIPAVVMIVGKITGVFLIIWVENLPWSFGEYSDSILNSGTGLRAEDIQTVTSYSDLFMYALVATYFSATLVNAILFHSSHVKPTLVARLANQNLMKLVKNSYEIYHAGAINLIFLWVTTALIILNVFTGNTLIGIGILATIVSMVLTTLLLHDVYREIENIKNKPGKYNWV